MWDLIVSVPDYCLSFYLTKTSQKKCFSCLLIIVPLKEKIGPIMAAACLHICNQVYFTTADQILKSTAVSQFG